MLDTYIDRDWKESAKGNFVCIEAGQVRATVYKNKFEGWQIIFNGNPLTDATDTFGRLVKNEYFVGAREARERAEAILGGAACELLLLLPKGF